MATNDILFMATLWLGHVVVTLPVVAPVVWFTRRLVRWLVGVDGICAAVRRVASFDVLRCIAEVIGKLGRSSLREPRDRGSGHRSSGHRTSRRQTHNPSASHRERDSLCSECVFLHTTVA